MTTEQINMAIAEFCGWKWYRIPSPHRLGPSSRQYRCLFLPALHEYDGQSPEWMVRADGSEGICNWQYMQKEGHVADYFKDLNAIHEAVSLLRTTGDQFTWLRYDRDLFYVLWKRAPGLTEETYHLGSVHSFEQVNATAAQRCEALLRTIGKWGDQCEK